MTTEPERPPLDAAGLRQRLVAGAGLWTSVDVVAQTGSTNADLCEAARSGAAEGTVLVAEYQYAGRGRSGRGWTSPPRAGIAVSVLLRPAGAATRTWGWLPLLAGMALTRTLARIAGPPVAVKWPNDVLVDGRKCAGILAEATGGDAVVLGLGVNVTLRADELPPAAGPVTSLLLAGAEPDRGDLLVTLLRELEAWYERWHRAGGDADRCGLREAYLADSATVGSQVRVRLPGGADLTGLAESVDPEGRLVVRQPGGEPRAVAAGDIVHLRPGFSG